MMQFYPTHNLITTFPVDKKWSRLWCVLFIAGAASLLWGAVIAVLV